MILGHARITAVDQDGRNFIADVGPGDLWFFPAGIPHSIQGLEDGCEFLLVLTTGTSPSSIPSRLQIGSHTHRKMFWPRISVYTKAPSPASLTNSDTSSKQKCRDRSKTKKVPDPYGTVPKSFAYRLFAQKPIVTPGGTVRIVDSSNFPISTTIAAALVEVKPGGMREMHWHPNNDEWQYYITGTGRMTVFAANGTARTFNYRAGDVGYVPFAMGHYIQNTGSESLWFLEIFKSSRFADISLNQWMALTPRELIEEHLHVGPELMNALRKEKWPVVKYRTDR